MRIVGVDIGGTSIKLGVFDEQGRAEKVTEYDTDSIRGGRYVLDKIMENISLLGEVDAIGVSTAGQVDRETGVIVKGSVNIPNSTGLQVKNILEERFEVPTSVVNDVHAAALGENHFGVGKALEDFLFVTYGTGVGGAMIQNGQVNYGRDGYSGEIGHMITHADGKRCNCGLHGCYEVYGSTTALVKAAQQHSPSYKNGKVIFDAFHRGDEVIQKIVDKWIHEVTIGLVSLIHIFNPSSIIVGGGIMEQEIFVEKIAERVNTFILPPFRNVEITKATLGNKAGMLGAISLHV